MFFIINEYDVMKANNYVRQDVVVLNEAKNVDKAMRHAIRNTGLMPGAHCKLQEQRKENRRFREANIECTFGKQTSRTSKWFVYYHFDTHIHG